MAEKYIKFRQTTIEPKTSSVGDSTLWIRPGSTDLYFEGTQFACLEKNVRTYVNNKFQEDVNSKLTFSVSSQTPSATTGWTTGNQISITLKFYIKWNDSVVTANSVTCTTGESVTVSSNLYSVTTKTTVDTKGDCSKTLTFNVTYADSTYGTVTKQFSYKLGCYAPVYAFRSAATDGSSITAATITGDTTKQSFTRSSVTGNYSSVKLEANKYLWFAFPSFLLSNGSSTVLKFTNGSAANDFPMDSFYTNTLSINNVVYYLIRKKELSLAGKTIDFITIR